MLPSSWRPEAGGSLLRVGPDADGGYVIPASALDCADVLLSLGLNDDWRFEEAFQTASGARVVCYDHTVDRSFWRWRAVHRAVAMRKMPGSLRERWKDLRKKREYLAYFGGDRAVHHPVMVGFDLPPSSTSLRSILEPLRGESIFMKMDIEGWEYRVLDQVLEFSDSVIGFVVEFHDVDLHRDRIRRLVSAAREAYAICHVHANNYGPLDDQDDPTVLEVTWVRRDLQGSAKMSELPEAGRLDFPNDPSRAEIQLRFESDRGDVDV